MLTVGTPAPEFSLPDVDGTLLSLSDVRGPKGLVVAFICNHCPYVLHLAPTLRDFADNSIAKGVGFVAINSNDVTRYAADSPEKMKEMANSLGWEFPYLYDESQATAKAYCAACTPDFYVFDGDLKLTYCGQFDSTRPGSPAPATGADLRQAVERVLRGGPPLEEQTPSSGCSIKWKSGDEPAWS